MARVQLVPRGLASAISFETDAIVLVAEFFCPKKDLSAMVDLDIPQNVKCY